MAFEFLDITSLSVAGILLLALGLLTLFLLLGLAIAWAWRRFMDPRRRRKRAG